MTYYPRFTYPAAAEQNFFGATSNALEAIGTVVVSFEDLDAQLGAAIAFLLRRGDSIGHIVSAELSFRGKLNLFGALFRAERPASQDLDRLRDLIGACSDAEDRRNQVLHSKWRLHETEVQTVVRSKYTARHKHGLRYETESLAPPQVQSLGFHCQYLAYCVDELMFTEFGRDYGTP